MIIDNDRFDAGRASEQFIRRTLDLLVAGSVLLVMTPVLLVIAAWIRLESPGPSIFRQVRVGADRRRFTLYKFRSMRTGGDDDALRELIASELRGEVVSVGGSWKIDDDPRVTRSGRLLRRTSLDEVPQLLNVLRGEMSGRVWNGRS